MRAQAVAVFLLSFIASTLAYAVTYPNNASGWSETGSQLVSWTMVDTDPANFTIVLVNLDTSLYDRQILAALVNGSLGSIQVNPPASLWPNGTGYRVNLVTDSQHLDSILAQSQVFTFTAANTTSSTGATATLATTGPTVTSPALTQPGTATTSGAATASIMATGAAAASYPVQTGLLALFSLLGFVLA